MTQANPLLGGVEQIALLVFVVMILVAMAGGNPTSVLSPLLRLAIDIAGELIRLTFRLLAALAKGLISLIPTLVRTASAGSTGSADQIH